MRFWLVAALVLVACGTGNETSTDGRADLSTGAATSVETSSADTPTTTGAATTTTPTTGSLSAPVGADLVGRWAHFDVVAYQDDVIKTLIVSYGFNDFSLAGETLVDQGSFCFSEQRTDQPIETSLSDAATQAIRPPPTPVTVDASGPALTISRPASPTPVGIRLDDPVNESLPTDPTDPRIVDDDGDGKPGITVTIRVGDDLSGELYLARREIFAYEAVLVGSDRLEGTVTDDSEQLLIGASDPLFLAESDWRQHPDPTKSPLILVRVDETWDCERLAAQRNSIFPPTPEVDW